MSLSRCFPVGTQPFFDQRRTASSDSTVPRLQAYEAPMVAEQMNNTIDDSNTRLRSLLPRLSSPIRIKIGVISSLHNNITLLAMLARAGRRWLGRCWLGCRLLALDSLLCLIDGRGKGLLVLYQYLLSSAVGNFTSSAFSPPGDDKKVDVLLLHTSSVAGVDEN